MKLSFHVVDFNTWRKGILPLWEEFCAVPDDIIAYHNTYSMMQYRGKEVFEKVLFFPVEVRCNETPVAYTSAINISDTVIRIRGIYVDPKYRGNGIAPRMLDYACNLFPDRKAALCYYKTSSVDYFAKHWNSHRFEDYDWRARVITKNHIGEGYETILAYKNF